jgi:hypothetical protein
MITFFFKKFFYNFKRSILGGIFLTNRHLFIFNGHGSHVTLEAIEQAQAFKLYMVTLHSHTSHALQPLDVVCFKSFNTTFKKERNTTMINNNYIELDKIVLAGWVDKTLHQTFLRKNIILGFKSIRIWLLDLKVTYERTRFSNLYIIVNKTREEQDTDYKSNQGKDGEMEWAK